MNKMSEETHTAIARELEATSGRTGVVEAERHRNGRQGSYLVENAKRALQLDMGVSIGQKKCTN